MLALVISTTSFLPTHGTSAGQPCFSPSRSSCAVVACADKLRAKVSAPRKVPHPVLAAVDKHCRRVPAPHLPHRSEACARCGSRARRRRSESYSGSTSPAVRLHQAFRPAFHLCPNGWCCSAPSGECRGRKLRTPDVFLRPMMSRVREVRARLGGGVRLGAHLCTAHAYVRALFPQALFSMLYPSGVVRNSAAALDLFAGVCPVCLHRCAYPGCDLAPPRPPPKGSGAVGLEALSRGMGAATFVDFSPK